MIFADYDIIKEAFGKKELSNRLYSEKIQVDNDRFLKDWGIIDTAESILGKDDRLVKTVLVFPKASGTDTTMQLIEDCASIGMTQSNALLEEIRSQKLSNIAQHKSMRFSKQKALFHKELTQEKCLSMGRFI